MAYTAVPNSLYQNIWRQIRTPKAEDEWNTTKSNAERIGNILETFATLLIVDGDRPGIRALLNSLFHVDAR